MPQIVLGNTDTDTMAPHAAALPEEFRRISAAAAKRMLWAAGPGDIVLLPSEVNPDFVSYVESLKSIASGSLKIVSVTRDGRAPHPICIDDLRQPGLLAEIRAAMGNRTGWLVSPYIADATARELAAILGGIPIAFQAEGQPSLVGAGDLLNDKRVYRGLGFVLNKGIPASGDL